MLLKLQKREVDSNTCALVWNGNVASVEIDPSEVAALAPGAWVQAECTYRDGGLVVTKLLGGVEDPASLHLRARVRELLLAAEPAEALEALEAAAPTEDFRPERLEALSKLHRIDEARVLFAELLETDVFTSKYPLLQLASELVDGPNLAAAVVRYLEAGPLSHEGVYGAEAYLPLSHCTPDALLAMLQKHVDIPPLYPDDLGGAAALRDAVIARDPSMSFRARSMYRLAEAGVDAKERERRARPTRRTQALAEVEVAFQCKVPAQLRDLWLRAATTSEIWCADVEFLTYLESYLDDVADSEAPTRWILEEGTKAHGLARKNGAPALLAFAFAGDGGHGAYHALDLTRPHRALRVIGPVDYPVMLVEEGALISELAPTSKSWISYVTDLMGRDELYMPWELEAAR